MTIGFAGIFAGVLVILARSVLQGQVVNSLTSDASLQVTIAHVYGISTSILKDVASGVIFIGIVLVAAAWFAGPARPAHATRNAIAPFLREQAVATYGIVLGIMVLLFIWNPIPATGKPLGILVFTVLALLGTYILIRQTAREFPDARSGAATQAIRARMASMRPRRHESGNPHRPPLGPRPPSSSSSSPTCATEGDQPRPAAKSRARCQDKPSRPDTRGGHDQASRRLAERRDDRSATGSGVGRGDRRRQLPERDEVEVQLISQRPVWATIRPDLTASTSACVVAARSGRRTPWRSRGSRGRTCCRRRGRTRSRCGRRCGRALAPASSRTACRTRPCPSGTICSISAEPFQSLSWRP